MPKFTICWTEATNHSVTIEADTMDDAIAKWENTPYEDYTRSATTMNDTALIDDSVCVIYEDGTTTRIGDEDA